MAKPSATIECPSVAITARSLSQVQGFLSPEQKIQARTLYLVHNLGPKEISQKLNANYKSVCDLIVTRGWAKLRNKNWQKAEAEILAIVDKDVADVSQRLAIESEELTFGSLRILRNSIATGNAKDMQMASGAARNLVEIARKCRNLDNKLDQSTGSSTNLNMFVFNSPIQTKLEKNVTPSAVQIV